MQISLEKVSKDLPKAIRIEGDGQAVIIYPASIKSDLVSSKASISVFTMVEEGKKTSIADGHLRVHSIGEYEHNGIFISVQKNSTGAEIDLVEVEVEGVRCVYYSSSKDIDRDLLNHIGVIDLAVLDVREDFDQQLKALAAIDPQVVIPVSAPGRDLTKFKQDLGIAFEQETKYKAKSANFQNEEYVLQGVELS